MNEPIIQANQSLIRNGDFSVGTNDWEKKGLSVGVVEDEYDNDRIKILHLAEESWVSQEFEIPRKPADQAQYRLSFLCETIHEQSGWLRIFKGAQLIGEIELIPKPGRHLEQDLARLAAGQPLAFVPDPYEQTLSPLFESGDKLRIEIRSPPNGENDHYSKVRIARINLQLHLEDLKLKTVKLDEQVLGEGGPLYLCLGATGSDSHDLTFEPEPDNAWEDTEASLVLEGNPQQAIDVRPGPEVDQLLTEHWWLDAPALPGDDSHPLTLTLLNRYNAKPFTISASLGHHRLKFRERLEAAYYPVLTHGQRVRLGVQVASFYTNQSFAGLTVNWSTAEHVLAASVSNADGWAYYDFLPVAAGEAFIEASVASPYYAAGVYTEPFTVRVLATDPWDELLAVVEGQETAWDSQGYPNRDSRHDVHVRLPADGSLLDTRLSLHWSGDDHGQLGVDVSPELESAVLVTERDMVWTLTSGGDLDGQFTLSLVCSKLLLPSPGRPMSLARNRVRIGEVREANKYPVVEEQESVLLRLQVLHETSLGDGDPVRNATVEWHTPQGIVNARSGDGGWASLSYTPIEDGDLTVTAHVKAHSESVPIKRPFEVRALASSPWQNQVEILLDGETVKRNTLGLVCRRGQSHTLLVKPVQSSWLGKNISLHWRGDDPVIGLQLSEPGVGKPLVEEGVQWTLSSEAVNSISSLFELELRLESVEVVRELSGRLLSAQLSTEFGFLLDQIRAEPDEQALYPCLGAIHSFNVLPGALSPLVGLQVALTCSGDPTDALGTNLVSTLGTSQTLSDGGAIWTLDFSESTQPGRFELVAALPELDFVTHAKPMVLAHNKVRIHAMREAAVDPVVGTVGSHAPAWLWVQVYSHFTQRPVEQVAVKWWDGLDGQTTWTDSEGWSGFGFRPRTGGMHSVTALVDSYFDNDESSGTVTVKSLITDPWADLLVSFDGKPEQLWGESTYFPRHKGQHRIDLKVPSGSDLLNYGLALGMTGAGPAELGLRFDEPLLGEFRRFNEQKLTFNYHSVGNAKNGSFGLCFAADRLASLSPVNAMSLGEGTQVVKIAERSRSSRTVLWGEAVSEQITVVSVISGRPMDGVSVIWRSPDLGEVTATTNYYGVARVRFVPTTPGEFELTATVGGALHSESIAIPLYLNQPRQILSLTSPKPSGQLGELVSATVNLVSALTCEPLKDVEVQWEYPGLNLQPTKTDAVGDARIEFRLPGLRRGWLDAYVPGGLSGWEFKTLEFELVPTND